MLSNNSYEVKRYNKPDLAVRKYKGRKLYLLPPAIFPHDRLDTTDQRYLKYNHSSIFSQLKKPINIEMYNDTYLSAKGQHVFNSSSHDKYPAFVDTITSKPHKNIPTITPAAEIFQE